MVKTELKPHQKRVKEQLAKSNGLIVAHGLGSGKTLSAINTIDTNTPTYVITPASLRQNFRKELSLHSGISPDNLKIMSYHKFLRNPTMEPGAQVILDEAHKLRNTDTQTYKAIKNAIKKSKSRLLLTATPIYNKPSDIAALVNISANKSVLPTDTATFNKAFISEKKVKPGFFKSMVGVKPGVEYTTKNERVFKGLVDPYIDKFPVPKSEEYPDVTEKVTKHLMSKSQKDVYKYVMRKAPLATRLKVRMNLPPSKSEAKNMNAFLSGARQVSNTTRPFGVNQTSAKVTSVVDSISRRLEKNPEFKSTVYSNYLEAGVNPVSMELTRRGIAHSKFTGKLSENQKAQIVDNYNTGKTPVMLLSSAGSEGLDLKGTRSVHVMEPHWNTEKIKQVVGRAARFRSHTHLPKEQQTVDVTYHQSILPQGKLSKFLKLKRATSTDEYIYNRAKDKEKLTNKFLSLIT